MIVPRVGYKRAMVRGLNDRLHQLAREFGVRRRSKPWEFVCECGRAECRQRVPLELRAYETLRATGKAIVTLGHS